MEDLGLEVGEEVKPEVFDYLCMVVVSHSHSLCAGELSNLHLVRFCFSSQFIGVRSWALLYFPILLVWIHEKISKPKSLTLIYAKEDY